MDSPVQEEEEVSTKVVAEGVKRFVEQLDKDGAGLSAEIAKGQGMVAEEAGSEESVHSVG